MEEKFSIKQRLKSFKYAFEGIKTMVVNEHNARVHVFAAILAILLCIILKVGAVKSCIVLICIGMVLAAEAFNTATEALADQVSPEIRPLIKIAKDTAAGAVLILAIIAAIIGIIIFLPPIIELFI